MRLELEAKSFGARPVLGALSLAVSRGERLAILGPSGIGKSTLLRILAGLDRAYRGRLDGADRLAVVFQEPVLLPWRDAVANIAIPTGCDAATARDWLAQVGLAGHEAKFPRQLSLGQQRRLALARAFAAAPDILLMDEPFASLDAETAGRMLALTDALLTRSGAGLVLVTHDPREAEALHARPLQLAGQPARLQTRLQKD
ncbi:ATP-binding cassette domain-containing protein [Paracoccus binzhouensis]|uniref:ATP-binding cassette domain-containing protein n=1 Tax=Paracoccus binzhouensis TaxID=2796149 RepID=UPI0018EF0090|nr:ATP-binding cassette domain-containing protein [Paracoccus binzhouensis]